MTADALGPVLAALADPTRRAIVDQLARGPARVTDVAAPFAMSLNAISKHLKVLERAGVVRREVRGREHVLALDAGPLREVARWAHRYERYWSERLDRLETFFAAKRDQEERDLAITRTIAARPDEVYDVWLDPKSPGGPWFGAARVILDAKVDGLFHHRVSHEGREWAHYGRFVALERPRRIAHTWVSEATRGLESLVTVSLEPDGNGTRVTLKHTGVPDDDFGRQHGEGWSYVLGAIEARFAKR